MKDINELEEYFMKPYLMDGVGEIYPVKIFDYDRFKELAMKYIIYGNKSLHDLYKVDMNINLLDFYVDKCEKCDYEMLQFERLKDYVPLNEEEKEKVESMLTIYEKVKTGEISFYSIRELEELFSMVTNKKVTFSRLTEEDYAFFIEETSFKINRDNFYELREVIMYQNLIHEQPTSPSKFGNRAIQRAINAEFGESSSSLASICSVVSCNSGVTDEKIKEYTYYRLIYDFTIINRTHGNIFSFMLRSQGCKEATISNLGESVDLHRNPYDSLFNKFNNKTGKIK